VTIAIMASTPGQAFVVQALGFAVVIAVLAKFVVPALKKTLGDRTSEIERTFRKIETDTAETSRRLSEIKDKLAHLKEESDRRTQAALDDANRTRAQALAEAGAQALAALEKARREIQIEREKTVLELREEATGLTLRAADALVQSLMNDPIHERLVAKYLDRLETVKKT
jgi:F-type H+-transporting ATPase subunit b